MGTLSERVGGVTQPHRGNLHMPGRARARLVTPGAPVARCGHAAGTMLLGTAEHTHMYGMYMTGSDAACLSHRYLVPLPLLLGFLHRYVVLNNLSLNLNTVGFAQIMKVGSDAAWGPWGGGMALPDVLPDVLPLAMHLSCAGDPA